MEPDLPVENQCYIPKRYILTALCSMGLFNVFAMRVSLSVAIVAMVHPNITEKSTYSNITNIDSECPNFMSRRQETYVKRTIGPQYNWDAHMQGLILGAFYYGNILTQLPAGLLARKVGAKWILGGSVLNTAIFSLLTPLITSWSATAFIVVRIIEGLGEGGIFPAVNVMISQWSPKMERSRLSSIICSGYLIGNLMSMGISGWLCSIDLFGGWPSVFYLFGTMGCVWFVFWALLVYETPVEHPSIALKELQYIQENNDGPSQKLKMPWKAMFSSMPMWALIVAHIGCDLGLLLFLADLPIYLSTVLKIDIEVVGILSALPFVVQSICAWIASYFADTLRKSNRMSITNIRKLFNSIGFFGPAICLLLITMSGCRLYLIISLITISFALNGCVYSGFNITHVDMSPTFAGTMYGITNSLASTMGFIGPYIVGIYTNKGVTMENWNNVFYITAGTYAVTAAFFIAFASAELQPWETEKEEFKMAQK